MKMTMAFSRRPWRFYGALWRSNGVLVDGVLFAFEITDRVLILKLRHEPMIVTMHKPSAFVQPCSNPNVTMP